jgi:hypothetical protein
VSYQVVFQREGHHIETIYWTGSLEETRELARRIAIQLAADDFRIIEFNRDAPEPCARAVKTAQLKTRVRPLADC